MYFYECAVCVTTGHLYSIARESCCIDSCFAESLAHERLHMQLCNYAAQRSGLRGLQIRFYGNIDVGSVENDCENVRLPHLWWTVVTKLTFLTARTVQNTPTTRKMKKTRVS